MFSVPFSVSNFAAWTPITTNCSGYAFSSFFNSGSTCMQLMQQYVQKSNSTTLPRSSFITIGREVLSHLAPPSRIPSGT